FIDPDGMAPQDVIIKGNMSQETFDELQASAGNELKLSMDENGNVTYTRNTDGPLSESQQQLVNAIDDSSIIVNVNTTNGHKVSDGSGVSFIGGAFSGNQKIGETGGVASKSIISTEQDVNPIVTKKLDDANDNPGATVLHEVVESYLGGLEAQTCGYEYVPPALDENYVYDKSHQAAPPQGGKVYRRYYDSRGGQVNALYRGGKENFFTIKKDGTKVTILEIQY
uniref:hypothetical protein n=1 Tax=Kordia zhangzhouensis TaxID=1620405 RepID=UPI00069A145D